MIIFFDIETILSIEKSEADILKKKMEESGKDGFDFMPEYHEVFTIATGVKTNEGIIVKNLEGTEREQIEKFFSIADKNQIAGFNIKSFDIPFLVKRALFHGIKIPNSLKLFGKKPWDMENIIDLYDVYKHTGYKSGSLDVICVFLGIPSPKEGIEGSQVQEYFESGRLEEIREYCRNDVQATILLYEKFISLNLM